MQSKVIKHVGPRATKYVCTIGISFLAILITCGVVTMSFGNDCNVGCEEVYSRCLDHMYERIGANLGNSLAVATVFRADIDHYAGSDDKRECDYQLDYCYDRCVGSMAYQGW